VCGRLARLTDAQWDDAFSAAGYEQPVARRFVARMKQKVADCLALTPIEPPSPSAVGPG